MPRTETNAAPHAPVSGGGVESAVPPTRDQRLWGWVQLVRPPNLFTVPGDIVAGVALGGGVPALALFGDKGFLWSHALGIAGGILVSLLLYIGGLILNDWCDRAVDAVERPSRPIPSGAVPAGQALVAAVVSLGAAIGLGVLLGPLPAVVTLAITALVVAYNTFAKRIPLIGMPTMAACRSLNLLLGGTIAGLTSAHFGWLFVAMGLMFAYIMLVLLVALHETDQLPAKWVLVLIGLFPLLLLISGAQRLTGTGCSFVWLVWLLAVVNTSGIVRAMWRNTNVRKTPPYIGMLIRNLVFIQGFWVATGGGVCFWVVGVVVLWSVGGWFGKWFYGS